MEFVCLSVVQIKNCDGSRFDCSLVSCVCSRDYSSKKKSWLSRLKRALVSQRNLGEMREPFHGFVISPRMSPSTRKCLGSVLCTGVRVTRMMMEYPPGHLHVIAVYNETSLYYIIPPLCLSVSSDWRAYRRGPFRRKVCRAIWVTR